MCVGVGLGLPWWLSGKESACQCRRHRFNPWVRKIPWGRKWWPTLVFLLGKSHGQRGLVGYSPKDLSQNIIYSPWGGIKGPWLCLMDLNYYYFVLLDCFPFFIFSFLWFNIFFRTWGRLRRLNFFYKHEASRGRQGWGPEMRGRCGRKAP